jgi:hypothetical protein
MSMVRYRRKRLVLEVCGRFRATIFYATLDDLSKIVFAVSPRSCALIAGSHVADRKETFRTVYNRAHLNVMRRDNDGGWVRSREKLTQVRKSMFAKVSEVERAQD